MTSAVDWRASLTATQRYENIQFIKTRLEAADSGTSPSHQSAFSIENNAYTSSGTRDEYDSACRLIPTGGDATPAREQEHPQEKEQLQTDHNQNLPPSDVVIGKYRDCHHVSGGVTSEVYRSQRVALKVIVETHNMEPHNPIREAKILESLKEPCIPLLETFRDQEQRFVLVMPFMPLTLEQLIDQGSLTKERVQSHFRDLFRALADIHGEGIIHRDIKPSALLLASPDGPAYLSDFGTAWHPRLSVASEPPDNKILDIGTGAYRAPEALFGDRSYGTAVDMWGAGVMLSECCRDPAKPLFESRAAHEDGNQLGLILSIFKTIGSPTLQTWPEAEKFKTPPFEMYQVFEGKPWDELLVGVDPDFQAAIKDLIRFESSTRASAQQVLSLRFGVN